jgi:hypothetical protein
MRPFRVRLPAKTQGNGPWAIASFIAIPLFFCSLMASTLAQEKAHVFQWNGPHHLITIWHEPTSANEARIWLWALLPPVLLSIVGWVCTRIPLGWYVACGAAIVEAFGVTHKLDTWTKHHSQRFPLGVDLIPSSNPTSNAYDQGEWEHQARQTVLSLMHWTVGLAAAAIVVMAALYVRRRYFARKPFVATDEDVLEGVHAPTATGAGIPAE